MCNYEDIILELARIEREALEAVRRKIAARQLGEAWKGLESEDASDIRRAA
jgi:hypothetical protein